MTAVGDTEGEAWVVRRWAVPWVVVLWAVRWDAVGEGIPAHRSLGKIAPTARRFWSAFPRKPAAVCSRLSKKETVDQIYQQIQEDLRNQYSLGYVPDRPGNASEYHKIHVTTTQKELVVQTRDGYYPAKQIETKQEKEQN